MSLIRMMDEIGATRRVDVEKRLGESIKLIVTQPKISIRRFILDIALGLAGIWAISLLIYPFFTTRNGNVDLWGACLFSIAFLAIAFNERRTRSRYHQKIEVIQSQLKLASNAFSTLPTVVEFETGRVSVTTTIPWIRGTVEFRERGSGRVLRFCENTPYYQRYFAAREIARYHGLEFTCDRELSDREQDLVETLKIAKPRRGRAD